MVAAALTVATLAGMLYYAIWLKWSPRLGREGLAWGNIWKFLTEVAAVSILALTVASTFGGSVTARAYGIEEAVHVGLIGEILIWGVIFFAVMTPANLFKFSRLPWIESLTYISGLIAGIVVAVQGTDLSMPSLLGWAALAMLLTQAFAVGLLRQISPNA